MGIQINGTTNNINAGIGSLSIEDISELDIVGVATAANFKTGVSNLHSLGLTLSGGQLDVGSNIKVGTAGVITATTFVGNLTGTATQVSLAAQSSDTDCYPVFSLDATGNQALYTKSNRLSFNSATGALSATSFVGDGSNLTGISGVSIANQGNDRLITATGTTDALNAEANLTFNGNNLQFNTTANGHAVIIKSTGNFYNKLSFDSGNTSAGGELAYIDFKWDGDKVADIQVLAGSDTTNKDDGHLVFRTSPSQGSIAERLRIASNGNIGIGNRTSSPDELLHVHTSSGEAKIHVEAATNARVRIRAHSGESIVQFADAASSNPGEINYTHSSDTMSFRTGGSVKAYIKSSGELWVGTNSGISNGGYGGISLNGSSGSLLSLMQNGTEYFRLFGDSNPALQFAGVLRLFSGVSGGSNIWSVTPNGTTTGANGVTFNLKSTISHTAAVMAVSSSYNAGDLYIRIDNIYNLAGNAWWTFGLWIMTNQTVGTLSGHHSAMIHCVITGLGSWSSLSANNIQGSLASNVSIDQHGTNFVELKVDVHDSSRGPCTVLCNGGTFDPPRISFH